MTKISACAEDRARALLDRAAREAGQWEGVKASKWVVDCLARALQRNSDSALQALARVNRAAPIAYEESIRQELEDIIIREFEPVDPLVEALSQCLPRSQDGIEESLARDLRVALAARGFAIMALRP
jgi:hypothetical protein